MSYKLQGIHCCSRNRRYNFLAGPIIVTGNRRSMKKWSNDAAAVVSNRHCIAYPLRDTNRSVELTRLIMAVVSLLFVSGCDFIGGGGDSESGIGGDGVTSAEILSKVGDGSSKSWNSATCELVEGKNQWRWGWWQDGADVGWEPELDESVSLYVFTIDKPGPLGEVWGQDQKFITLLKQSHCKISSSTKVAYTTKDWLCSGDNVKVDGKDCIISTIE